MARTGRPPNTIELVMARRISRPCPSGLANPPSGNCLEWPLARDPEGYGRTVIKQQIWRVHRLVWTHFRGAIPHGKQVQHLCNNPSCSNIDHLALGECIDNHDYMKSCGRAPSGFKNGRHTKPDVRVKLTKEIAAEIRASSETDQALADRYRVARSTVTRVRNGTRWAHDSEGVGAPSGSRNGANTSPETRPKGESHGAAILTASDVREIRESTASLRELARTFKVSHSTIASIRARRTWND